MPTCFGLGIIKFAYIPQFGKRFVGYELSHLLLVLIGCKKLEIAC